MRIISAYATVYWTHICELLKLLIFFPHTLYSLYFRHTVNPSVRHNYNIYRICMSFLPCNNYHNNNLYLITSVTSLRGLIFACRRSVEWLVGRSVGWLVGLVGGKLHFHTSIGALVLFSGAIPGTMFFGFLSDKCGRKLFQPKLFKYFFVPSSGSRTTVHATET